MPPTLEAPSSTKLEERIGERSLILETGVLAKQAGGAVKVQMGETCILAAATAAAQPRPTYMGFTPLTVDYRERTYAAGKIPGGWFRREGRPREKEVLSSRLTDRSIRPLFPEGYNTETMVQIIVLSVDQESDSDVLAIIGASSALMVSNVPWNGPVGAVRVGSLGGKLIFNPSFEERDGLELELVVSGTKDAILMVEGGASEVPEDTLVAAMEAAHAEIRKICAMQERLASSTGKPKTKIEPPKVDSALQSAVEEAARGKVATLLRAFKPKEEFEAGVKALKAETSAALEGVHAGCEPAVKRIIEDILYEECRRMILEEGVRADGRKPAEIRAITIETGCLPRTHGSALFTRGQTQALVTATLGTPRDSQIMDELEGEYKERFLLHYNFPGFSTGEVKPERGPGRREIGHGVLAKRALYPLLPAEEEFAYTLRVVSDILESNGSSSMASVCGGSLALFDAGVPVKRSCAGIAMGLILEGDRHAVLTDILGMEDHLGDMDFKVAGTRQGITAFQMDVKNEGVPMGILREALVQTREARMHILDTMDAALPAPRKSLSPHAPRLVRIMIPVSKIGALIGPGGKNIRRLIEGHGVEIEVEDDGSVFVSGLEAEKVEAAQREIEAITTEPEVGKIYKGRVVSITDFGAFVEILPGQEGLLHISQIAEERIARVEDVLKEGDQVEVKVLEIDNNGKMRLSRKAVLKPGSELKDAGPGPRRDRDDRGGRPPWGGKSGGRPRPGRGGFRR